MSNLALIVLDLQRILSAYRDDNEELMIENAPTHEEIARRLGTNCAQDIRVTSDFAKRGVITQSRQSWSNADVDPLRVMIERRCA
ncbi:MAG: hypothetical protein ACI9DC_002602 [Gammaproteobacteria bacterium]|jgi:hypothetical protein